MLFLLLKNIRLNEQTNQYEAMEGGFYYKIDYSLFDSLKAYFQDNPYLLLANWYRSLDDTDKEKVKKTSVF
jgi:hypothetical protein